MICQLLPDVSDAPLHHLLQKLADAPCFGSIAQWSHTHSREPLYVTDAAGSLPAFILQHLWQSNRRLSLCILPEAEDALYLHGDLEQITTGNGHLLLFPPSGRAPYDREQVADSQRLIQRADVLQQLSEGFHGILVTSIHALVERTPAKKNVEQASRTLALGDTVKPEQLVRSLTNTGFERVRFVDQPGEVAWRGGIVDVYSYASGYPIRIEFLGDEIDSLREFDAYSQRSVSSLQRARIAPRMEHFEATRTNYASLFDYLERDAIVVLFDSLHFASLTSKLYEAAVARYEEKKADLTLAPPPERFLDNDALQSAIGTYARLHFGTAAKHRDRTTTVTTDSRPQPAFNRQMAVLRAHLAESAKDRLLTCILCDSTGQKDRLSELLDHTLGEGHLKLLVASLHQGFALPAAGLAIYTDHEIFGRHHRPATRKRKRQGGIRLHELHSLEPGDHVVHSDYGIGTFAGFRTITVRGKQQEVVRLHYAGGDVLHVNINALYKLHKYSSKEGHAPKLTKLGTGQWERSKRKAKKRIKDIARDLIQLYAKRKASPGHRFSPDSVWQTEMEASFAFEDTPDQFSATEAVKRDMESPAPMDRLICGDVGFGKTEVAVRAAFKAVQDGRQVAVLVPTTVLARQHQDTFSRRLEHFPVKIAMLSRHRTAKTARNILEGVKTGQIDILIGTHRITSKDVVFKHLGLLIVDEEQRFGVHVKERLRQLRASVDTLTLTATPIPRTLQFSLMGARDLSIINTPPQNRQSIVTEIHSFDHGLVRDAILYEVSRGGQVFFVHNRVHSMEGVADMLRELLPGVRLQMAHGRMGAAEQERVMTAFIDRKIDVLISTTIIENGLDIANANTMIIHQAQRFGLAELHQLRGRVGRSHRKAFCYLLVPSIHALTRQARQRLRAVEQLSDLGSGFQIAMRDLDIRGAGNVLGGEQSGFITDLGLATYQQVLDEAVSELRTDEFPALAQKTPVRAAPNVTIDIEADATLPVAYVDSDLERLGLYRRISEAATPEELGDLAEELSDRFGPLPTEAHNLLTAAHMRLCAQKLRLPRVVHRKQRLFLHLPMEDDHFREHCFQPLMEQLKGCGYRYVMKESKRGVPRAIIQQVSTLRAALALLKSLAA